MNREATFVLSFLVACTSTSSEPVAAQHRHDHPASARSGAPEHHPHGMHHDFSDAARWAAEFDDPARDAWQKPDEVVKLLAIPPGATVVDVGAGTGYFEKRLADAVGPSGKVIALDVEANMVAFMRDRFEKAGVRNVDPRVCPPDQTGLPPGSADRVLIVDTWHHLDARPAYAKHLAGLLREGGTITVVDFTPESPKGPPRQHKLAPQAVVDELVAGGLDAKVIDEPLPDQYVVVASKPRPR